MTASLQLYRRLLRYARPYANVVGLSLLAMLAAAALEPVMPWLLKQLVDTGFVRKDLAAAWQLPLWLTLAFVGKGLSEYAANVASQWVAQRAIADLRQQVFEHQTGLPLAVHQAQAHGRMISLVLSDIPQVGQALSTAWIIVIRDTLIVIGLTAFLLWTAWQLTLLVVLVAPLVALLIRAASSKLRGSNTLMQQLNGRIAGVLDAALVGVREVKIFGARAFEGERFRGVSEQLRRATMRTVRVQAANVPLVQMLAAVAVSGVIFAATALSAQDALTPGEFIAFITAMSMLFEPLRRLTTVNGTIQSGLAAAQSIFALLGQPLEVEGAGATRIDALREAPLVFDDVRFAYPGQAAPALAGFSLALKPGQTVALVGRSGSGKTTVASLLARFHAPDAGTIRLGAQPIGEFELGAWRAQIAWVGQHATLFDDSVAANIAYGRPGASEAQIREAARLAHALEFIERLPQGLATPCGHNGVSLSGGQRQRIAIARAFLRDSPLLVLDEATSALDYESERHVQEALAQLMQSRTTLVIAHRLTTVRRADLIAVMEQGRVVEQGGHDELMARDGAYARLWQQGEGGGAPPAAGDAAPARDASDGRSANR